MQLEVFIIRNYWTMALTTYRLNLDFKSSVLQFYLRNL